MLSQVFILLAVLRRSVNDLGVPFDDVIQVPGSTTTSPMQTDLGAFKLNSNVDGPFVAVEFTWLHCLRFITMRRCCDTKPQTKLQTVFWILDFIWILLAREWNSLVSDHSFH